MQRASEPLRLTRRAGTITRHDGGDGTWGELTIAGAAGDLTLPQTNLTVMHMDKIGSVNSVGNGVGLDPVAGDAVSL